MAGEFGIAVYPELRVPDDIDARIHGRLRYFVDIQTAAINTGVKRLDTRSERLDGMKLSPGDANPLAQLKGGLYDIEIEADPSAAKQLVLDIRGQELVFDVTDEGLLFGELKIPDTKTLLLRVVVDNTSTDVFFGEHGLYHSPGLTQPSTKNLSLGVTGGNAIFTKLKVHELKSLWGND